MSRFAPVFLPKPLGNRASQTFLRAYSACPRSGYLYSLYRDVDSQTAEMVRGKAVHLIHERAVRLMVESAEPVIPADLVKTLADEVLAELPVPFSEHDAVREMAWRIGSELAVDPDAVVALETLFALDVTVPCVRCALDLNAGGSCEACGDEGEIVWEVRCRIDFAELLDHGARVHVEDLKSSKAAVTQDEISRKRPDGSLTAKSLQLVLYALALVYGVPVREETCPECGGAGIVHQVDYDVEPCPNPRCSRGRIETREPFPVAPRAHTFDLEYVYPAIEDSAGRMFRRAVTLTRGELEQYRTSLQGLVTRLAASEVTGDWPAVVSDAACSECTAAARCPIPVELRDHRGSINEPEECAEALEVRQREKKVSAAKTKEITAFVKRHGPVRFGGGMVALIEPSSSTEIKDKDGFLAAVDRAARFGEPLDRSAWVKDKTGSRLVVRALTQDEIDSEGSNDG